jgi:hypothetical protein
MRSVAYRFSRLGNSTPRKYTTHIAALATALRKQYTNVLVYMCPPYPDQPGGNVVLGYQRTEKESDKGSPMVIFVFLVCDDTEYAVAASTVPGLTDFGDAWTRRLRLFPTCKWLSCNVPANAIMRGVYMLLWLPIAPS